MSESTVKRSSGNAGLPFLLFLLILALLLGVVTTYAIRYNPLYSDRDAYGISKYMFIEQCKEKLHDASTLDLSMQGQTLKLGEVLQQANQLRTGESIGVHTTAASRDIVGGVQGLDANMLGLATPVNIVAQKGTERRVLAPASMQCMYDKTKKATQVQLVIGQ